MALKSNKPLESKKKTNYDMYNMVMNYFSILYSHGIAKKVVPILLYSSILQKFVHYEIPNNARYRLNVLFHWAHGWFKSSILKRFSGFLPIRNHDLTSSSAAALRGSFIDGKFYPPELLINDIHPSTSKRIKTKNRMKKYGLQYQDQPYEPEFWKNYNVIKRTKLDDKIIEDLERDGNLEQQFEGY